jgi:hypothetical protein
MAEPIPPDALLAGLPAPMPELAHELRAIVKRAQPDAIEAVRPGWRIIGYDVPLGRRRRAYFAWIMAEREHVHLGFPRGVLMRDPAGVLHGAGEAKLARWLTVRQQGDVDRDVFEDLVREAAAVALIPRTAGLSVDLVATDPRRSSTRR